MQAGDYAHAVDEFQKALALQPGLVEAEINLGLAYHSLGEYGRGARYLTLGLREKPDLVTPTVIAGIDYLKDGDSEKAIPLLEHALKLDPANREARQALASSFLAKQEFASAAREFRSLADSDPDKAEALFKIGHEYLDISARLAYRGAHLYRESAWGHRFLGDLLFQRNNWNEAAREYGKALAAESVQPGLHAALGEAYLHSGKLEEATAEFHREADRDNKDESAWLGLAETALKQGRAPEAHDDIAKVWQISPEFLSLPREFPTIELPPDRVAALITGLQALQAEDPASHFLLAALFSNLNQSASAERESAKFQSDLSASQQKSLSLSSANAAPCAQHRYSACAAHLHALKNPNEAQRLLLGKTLYQLHRYSDAAAELSRVTGVNKANDEASYGLALSYRALGAECYANLEERFPDSWRTHQLRGEGYALKQDLENAIREFQSALALQPNAPDLHEALGDAYLSRHSDDDAERELKKALELDPSRARVLYLLGRLYTQRRDNESAVRYLQQAVRLEPDFTEASSLLGTAYVRMGKFSDALPQLEKAAGSDHYGNIHYQLYLAYRKLGHAASAQKALAQSQELRRSSLERDQALVMGAPEDPE